MATFLFVTHAVPDYSETLNSPDIMIVCSPIITWYTYILKRFQTPPIVQLHLQFV